MVPRATPEDTLKASYAFGSAIASASEHARPLRTFLFGYPIAHSMAPMLHQSLFKSLEVPWTYTLLETQDKDQFLPALKQDDIIGCAVTMPYKVVMMSAVDEVIEEGRMIGAINTVFLRKGPHGERRYIGTNTDCVGVREAFLQNFPDILEAANGKPGLVIGGGGAARAAVYALWKWLGVSKLYMVNRLKSEVDMIIDSFQGAGFSGEIVWVESKDMATGLDAPALIVGTIPDFAPQEEGEKLAKDITTIFLNKPEKGYILEMCYHPNPVTAFFSEAAAAGWKVLPGTESMIYQGVAQQVLWAECYIYEREEGYSILRLSTDLKD
ncbi:NAD-P-binding protein [Thozetella sp. PMI_491]|nr:NAD-P-binding protein [Thozetella sp. PMI_491]